MSSHGDVNSFVVSAQFFQNESRLPSTAFDATELGSYSDDIDTGLFRATLETGIIFTATRRNNTNKLRIKSSVAKNIHKLDDSRGSKKLVLFAKAFYLLILMDLSKAFHCLHHKPLIAKFEAYGFSRSALKLIYNYYI